MRLARHRPSRAATTFVPRTTLGRRPGTSVGHNHRLSSWLTRVYLPDAYWMLDAEPANTHSWQPLGDSTLPVSTPCRGRSSWRSARLAIAVSTHDFWSGTH